jgi:hypothetical protein
MTWLIRRPKLGFAVVGCVAVLLSGCATIAPRHALPQASADQTELTGFHNIRFWEDASPADIAATVTAEAPEGKRRFSLGLGRHQPTSNVLAISGGAEDGAFGAGLLVGWSDAGARPSFDLVTGVSSGALIAPFAFFGKRIRRSAA